MQKTLKVALAHDYFIDYGGAERVVEELHAMFPDAPVYTAFVNKRTLGSQWKRFASWDIRESWAKNIPGIDSLYSPMRVLSDEFFASFDFSAYDVVVSSTNMYMAKAIRTVKPTVHICYCHTPPRSLYGYSTMTDWKKNPFIKFGGELMNHYMRLVDFRTAQHPDVFIANSQEVQRRIQKFYRRDAVVIYPPIVVPKTLPRVQKEDAILFAGRLAASKHAELVVAACTTLKRKLYIAGSGKMETYLRSIAGPTVEFLGSVSDETLRDLYARSRILIYPAEDEDFGMIPVEAMAYGTPVIVHRSGGFLETVVEGKTGIFIDELTEKAVIEAIHRSEKVKWDPRVLHAHAQKFSGERFRKEISSLIQKTTKK